MANFIVNLKNTSSYIKIPHTTAVFIKNST
jgi:hypothetical protein